MYQTYCTAGAAFLRKMFIFLLFIFHQLFALAEHVDKSRLIVIDEAVQAKDYFFQQRGVNDKILLLNASADIDVQIQEVFRSAKGFDELHFISHGRPGKLLLAGGRMIDAAFIKRVTDREGPAKTSPARPIVYLYGCDVAKGDDGKAFVRLLSEKYGSRVYASTDISGGASTDGNGILEFSTGEIDEEKAVSPLDLNKYVYTLQTYNFTTSLDARNEHWTTAYLPVTTTYTEGANDVLRLTLTESGTAGNGSGCVVITINGPSGLGQLSPSACGYGNSNNWDKTLSVKKNAGLSFGGGSITFKPITYNPGSNPATQELLLNFYIRGFKNGTQTGEIHRTNLVHNQNYTIDISAEAGFADIDDLQFFIDNNEVLIDQLVLIPAAAPNSAPTDIALSATAVNENVAANTTVGTLSSTDPDAGNTFTYTLVSGTGSADNASFNISGNSLRITNSPDFETKSSYSVRVRTTDQGALTYEKVFTISITNVNETPTDISLSATALNENVAANTTVGTLSSTDPDAGNTFTYTLVSGTGSTDNASFNIIGNSLRITNSPDFETKSSYSVRVRTTDQGTLTYEKVFTISITNVNETPTDISLSATALNENVAANTTVGTLSSTDPDAGNTFTYTLVSGTGSTDNASFNISGNSLRITNSPDFETKSSYSVRVRTTDQGTLTYEKVFTISITNVNETPTDISLSATALNENVAANTTVGSLSSTDPDAGNTFTYTLVSGTGSTDNASFNISGNNLRITNSPDFETKSSYSVRVRTTDQGTLAYEKVFTISITNVNETPTDISLSATALNENVAANTTVGSLSSTDPDAGNTFTYTLVSGAGSTDNASFIIAGNDLQINLSPDFESKSSYSVRMRTTDQGGLSFEKVFTVSIVNVNEDPAELTCSITSVNENIAANTIIGSFSTDDPEGNNNHTYSFATGRGDADNGSFTLVGNSLRINVSPDFETKHIYSIRIRTTDAGGLFIEKSFNIIIDDINEIPGDISLSATAINENVAANTTVGLLNTNDPDAGNTFTYTLVAGAGSTDNASFNINGNSLRIALVPDFETRNSYSIRLRSTDQDGLFVEKTFTISISDLLDNPVINASGTLSAVHTTYGTPTAAPASFTISANFLTSNLNITAPAGYEISESVSTGYAAALSISPLSGNISTRNIYVRLSATAGVGGSPYSGNILAASAGAPNQQVATIASTVSPKAIQVTGIIITDKVYDALIDAAITGTALLTGVEATDAANVVLGGTARAVFADAFVGNLKTVTVSGYTISGAASSNYTLLQPAGLTASVSARTVTISGMGVSDKVYDGLPVASITGTPTLNGIIAADAANVLLGGVPVASFTTATVGTNKTVLVTGYTLTGSAAANYTLTQPSGLTATVTARPLTISGINVSNKVYDGLISASLTGNAVLNGVLPADVLNVVLSGTPVASFSSARAEANKAISVSGYTLTGSAAANYNLTQPSGLRATIQQKALTVSGIGISDKTYDGSTSATISGTAVLNGVVAADAVNVVLGGTTAAAFATAAVGTGKTVTVNGFAISGTAADNYTLVAPSGFTANIRPASLVVTANTVNKMYGQSLAGVTGSTAFTVTGLQNGESVATVTVSYGNGSAATAAVGTYTESVTISALSGGTFQAGNYIIVYRSADIIVDKATMIITAGNRSKTYGTTLVPGTTDFTVTGLQNSDQVSAVNLATSGAAATAATGNYSMLVSNAVGVGLENYNIIYVNGVLTITPALLVITADSRTKIYGATLSTGSTAFGVSGLLNNDAVTGVTLTSNGVLATAAAGTYTITPSAALGTGLNNYLITYNNGTLTVNRASLTITAANQVRCEGAVFSIPANAYTVNGLLNNDQVNRVILFSTGTSATAGTYAIEPSGATGAGLDNYTINYVNGVFTVRPLPDVTASGNVNSISKGGTVTLTATGTGTFRWSPVANLANPNNAVTTARVTATTTYTVQLTDANGCVNNASVTVNAIEDLAVEVPLAFTPNGDGINDRFIIRNLDQYPQNTLQVFDRTGKVIYRRENYNNDWNGMVNGKMITRDTYFYILTIKDRVVKKGAITVVL